MSFPSYPRYKDSGVQWLGEVPEHWEVRRLGYYFRERREKVSDRDFAPLSVTRDGIVPQLETAAKTDDGDNRKGVRRGDFVINSRSDRKGSAGISPLDGSVSLISTVIQPQEAVDSTFIHHLLRCQLFQEEYYRFGKGIVADLWSTTYSEMRNILLAVPPLVEQQRIGWFVERETKKLNELIVGQQRLVELLKGKRQAVISHAVTRGLEPDASMKPSGVEWLGDVPVHWEVRRFTQVIRVQEGPGIMAADFVEDGVPLLRLAGVQGRWASLAGCNFLDPEKVAKRWDHFRLNEGDLVISGSASTGTVCEVGPEVVGSVPYTGLMRLVPVSGLTVKHFVRALVGSALFFTQIDQLKAGATIQHFGPSHLARMIVTVPPIEEQESIAAFVDSELSRYEQLIRETESAITLLQERRSGLISAAVTGKIDVRGLTEAA